jgi:CheY-like chemotaxis protein
MTNQNIPDFIVIDDDPLNNLICTKNIQKIYSTANIQTFTQPQLGLEYIVSNYRGGTSNNTVLFLDINMPVLSGWDVLGRFTDFPEEVKKQFTIYILSSSIATEDKARANECYLVTGFIEKPLTIAKLEQYLLSESNT